MNAIVCTRYGTPDVLLLQDVEKPVPKAGEVLIEVQAVSLNAADWHLLTADIFVVRLMGGLRRPKYPILGSDVAGRVAAVGAAVQEFNPGDSVFGCLSRLGGLAEFVCADARELALKPSGMSFEAAATVPMAAVSALQALRTIAQVLPGQTVLINGASGGVGTFAVQIAKALGAEVTAVCSTGKMDLVRELGADHVIDYTREDFTARGTRYDVILGVNGYHRLKDYQRALTPTGTYVMLGGKPAQIFEALLLGPLRSRKGGQTLAALSHKPDRGDLEYVADLITAGKVASIIDRQYPLSEAPAAFRYLGAGHARGKIVVTVADSAG
jgi:NADPH:quinone reductase-like Zn-dependent oxidoreductase